MGPVELVQLGCGAVGAALLLWIEWRTFWGSLVHGSEVWWQDGKHDEVEMFPGGDGGEQR